VKPQPMTLSYRDHFSESPKAYERVFLDAIKSDHHLFTTAPEVLETWRILAPVQEAWASAGKDGLVIYPPGASIDAITGSDTFQ
jgi:glucose-6-phosphate 1-dehydrogenase